MLAKDVMKSPVITISENDTLADVARVLQEHNISGLPVLNDKGELVGIITEHDLIHRSQQLQVHVLPSVFGWISPHTSLDEIARYSQGLCTVAETPVHKVMTRKVFSVEEDESLESVAQVMARRRINRVPVTRNQKLVGIISRGELVWAMSNLCERKPGVLS